MSLTFPQAVEEAEEEQILEACRTLHLDDESTAYVLAKHRHSPKLLGLIQVMGGGLGDYIRMRLETRRALLDRRR